MSDLEKLERLIILEIHTSLLASTVNTKSHILFHSASNSLEASINVIFSFFRRV